MSISDADIAFAKDLFHDIPDLSARKMFGGICLYSNGIVFALMSSDGRLYIKTKTPDTLYDAPCDQFHNMPYWSLPDAALDDPQQAQQLAQLAINALS